MTFHEDDMSRDEIHGTLLRTTTDELVQATDDLETRTDFLLRRAEAIADSLAIRNEVRAQIYGEDSEV